MKIIASWPKLASLGNNKIVKSSYIWIAVVPIFAKLLNNLPNKVCFTLQNNYFLLDISLPFSWKFFFFSALFFAIATFIFSLTCPPLIKDFTDMETFKSKGLTKNQLLILFATWIKKKPKIKDANGKKINNEDFINKFITDYTTDGNNNKLLNELNKSGLDKIVRNIQLDKNKEIDAYWLLRSVMSNSHDFFRFIITFFYLLGFSLLLYILILNIKIVIEI
ncbi:hypothetical protein [Arcobacter sp. L]|uniref:hypothetical protein n=1 Tax=Arcobacter sp. L TaxID=944547 RepID=UPI0002296039|nr:hypothetical protein [Arcobacter sp. L]BAK74040.1 hypothetical protein ABLL_2165 [Arcobacter sp. L]